ncbi:Glu/Leu/Phe/Val dehydrogenase dimerization domain-containing protein [Chengkuizengella axinellae]|uniref:Glu/Leu/Phe/Val dehydrogenase dimerization domain-containing protein n=1 Tax=Chengkuizengella axinellae TaxID=3064388 RepID=A0ABT9J7U7_9BACL|nr:Glu/Leu/Phe/Val dehydrogenase dimerization domain-containing protein [Chengkuizengella sp. 2205SS18-9]MDP5277065.1 Glu/Leu/Phe/Val dehydrogenase dimerization domain-containing protein [Chengkuizengella sp. 2205SS18-9]
MEIFKYMENFDYEQVVFCQDKKSGLKAIVSIHDTTLGPALGGSRMWPYVKEEDAILDVLRLSRGMTYKAAAGGLNLGGGKSVIIGDPKTDKNPEMFRAFGRFIEGLNGRYITAEDVGTTEEDMNNIHKETNNVTGVTLSSRGAGGNPSPSTGYGVFRGLKAAAVEKFGTDSLEGKVVAVQGLGNVAYALCQHLHKEGAKLVVTDINKERVNRVVEEFGANAVDPKDIYGVNCDIFSPNALGAVINDETIPQLKAKVIAGGANNQLQQDKHGDKLHELGILYAPDYIINVGGLIHVADELKDSFKLERVLNKVKHVYQNMQKVIEISKRDQIATHLAANRMAEERLEAAKKVK